MPDIPLGEIYDAEGQYISDRRKSAETEKIQLGAQPGQPNNDLLGLAISGGGIRSATFSLGIIQALEEKDVFRHVDYLSTVSGGGYTGSLLSANLKDKSKSKDPTPIKRTTGQEEPPILRHLRDGSNYLAPGGLPGLLRLFGPITFKLFHTIVYLISFLLIATLATELIHENLIGPQGGVLPYLSLSWPLAIGLLIAGCLIAATAHFHLNWKKRELLERGMTWILVIVIGGALLAPLFNLISSAIELPLEGPQGLEFKLQQRKWPLIWSSCALITLIGFGILRARHDLSKWYNHLFLYSITLLGPAFLFSLYLLLCVAQVDSAFIQSEELASELSKPYTTKPEFFPITDELRDQLEARGIFYLGDGHIQVPIIYLPPQKTGINDRSHSWLLAKPIRDSLAPPSKVALEGILAAKRVPADLASTLEIKMPPQKPQSFSNEDSARPQTRSLLRETDLASSRSMNLIHVEKRLIDEYFYQLKLTDDDVKRRTHVEVSHYDAAISIAEFDLRRPLNLPTDVPNQIIETTISSELRDRMASELNTQSIRYKVSDDVRVKSFFHGRAESTDRYWISNPDRLCGQELEEVANKTFLEARQAFFGWDKEPMDRWVPIDQSTHSSLYQSINRLYRPQPADQNQIKVFHRNNLPPELMSLLRQFNPDYQYADSIALLRSPQQQHVPTVYLRRTEEQRSGDPLQEFLFKSDYHWMAPDTAMHTSDFFRLKRIASSNTFEIVGAGLQFFRFSDVKQSIALIQEKNHAEWLTDLEFLGITTVLILICIFLLNPNQSSLLYSYRDRLSRLYLVRPQGTDSVKHCDNISLSDINQKDSAAPYHLLNATLNMGASYERGIRGRRSDFFLFSKLFCGSKYVGYCRTNSLEARDPKLNLGTAMAISAAAAAPNMGAVTIRPLVFAMTMLNIRLSYWLPNPKFVNRPRARKYNLRMWYLIREAMGWLTEKSPFINLSDGGHIENLGLYELIRRKVKYIIAIDGECDPSLDCPSLVQLIRYARIDHGVEITFPEGLKTLKPDSDDATSLPYSRKSWLLGEINYGTVNGEQHSGYLIYIKATCPKNEGPVIRQYRRQSPSFPHETTADQFFTEEQFEAYRELGETLGKTVIDELITQSNLDPARRSFDSLPFLPNPTH